MQLSCVLAVYLKSITRDKGIRVVSFLRGRVNTADYILASAANTIMGDYTTRLEMNVNRGVGCILREGSSTIKIISSELFTTNASIIA